MTTRSSIEVAHHHIVPFAESHIPTFTAWFNELPGNDVWTVDAVRRRTTHDSAYDPALMLAIERNDAPVGFILGSITNEAGWIRAFLVHPDWQRQGIGTAIFDAVERVFARRAISELHVGWVPSGYFLPGIDVKYTSAIVFLDQRGYQTERKTRVNMDVSLQGRDFDTLASEARLLEQGIAVRRSLPHDRPGITDLCIAHDNLGWAAEAGEGLNRDPVTVFVAERSGVICAFAAHSICGPVHFGPMLTAAGLRGQGIGSVLLKHCLRDWQRAGVERCEVVWTGPLSFYARSVGATMGRAFWTYHRSQ